MMNILIVDDEEAVRRLLKNELSRKGHRTDAAADGREALERLREDYFDIMLLDIVMPGMDGLSLLKKLKGDPYSPASIILTGKATVDTAVEAMKNGAYDYITKPYKLEELNIIIERAYEQRKLRIENKLLQQELARRETLDDFIGKSASHMKVLQMIEKIAPTHSTVLITGESGTGKELVANHIWKKSARAARPLIALNCATFSENLIESELFGHEKGAFTSAHKIKYGLVESAHEGTLFLDEIAELPLALQAKLLRFLDSGEFRRVGGTKPLRADVRLIAATNKNLEDLMARGAFREDLYYRLNVLSIPLPPLRERKEDIEPLANYFLRKYEAKLEREEKTLSPDALSALSAYDWPGNIRELENVIERALILSDSDVITEKDLSIPQTTERKNPVQLQPGNLNDIEREAIKKALHETGGNQTRASRLLGIDRKTLYLKLKKYGLEG
jgi:two-component system response regulator AtoC